MKFFFVHNLSLGKRKCLFFLDLDRIEIDYILKYKNKTVQQKPNRLLDLKMKMRQNQVNYECAQFVQSIFLCFASERVSGNIAYT